jgi:hypothetical protein
LNRFLPRLRKTNYIHGSQGQKRNQEFKHSGCTSFQAIDGLRIESKGSDSDGSGKLKYYY